MFSGFFYALRSEGVDVSLYEWMTLMRALSLDLAGNSMTDFYYLGRSVLVKSETHYDRYDAAFIKHFGEGAALSGKAAQPQKEERAYKPENFFNPENYKSQELPPVQETELSDFKGTVEIKVAPPGEDPSQAEEGMDAQGADSSSSRDSEGGTPSGGVRFGGEGGGMTAIKIAGQRKFKDYRDGNLTDTRQFEIALRSLRQLSTKTQLPKSELNLEATIEQTGNNAGMLTLVWDRPRKNAIKVIVLMDSVGSIDRHHDVCKKLFNAAHKSTHFKEIKFFYFHNCIYGAIYKTQWLNIDHSIPTDEFFRLHNSEYRVLIVGDAQMSEPELMSVDGVIDWSAQVNTQAGITWLGRIARHFPYCVWLNPVPKHMWGRGHLHESIGVIEGIFPMFELTPSGIEQAVKRLRVK